MRISDFHYENDLVIYCNPLGCRYSAQFTRSEAIGRFGGDMDLDRLRGAASYPHGHRGTDLIVQFVGPTGKVSY